MDITLTISSEDEEDLANRAAQSNMTVTEYITNSLYIMGRSVRPETVTVEK